MKYISLCSIFLLFSQLNANESVKSKDLAYRKACARAFMNSEYFRGFRSMQDYSHVIEIGDGVPFIQYLLSNGAKEVVSHVEAFRELDTIGSPPTLYYPNFGSFSATTLRYICIADDIYKRFKLPERANIVELGGGFGGQCYILSQLYDFANYSIYDLPDVNRLIQKVVNQLEVENVNLMFYQAELPHEKIDLFISNYGFSECERHVQMDYFERVIKKADRGYMIYNNISDHYAVNSMPYREFVLLLYKNGIRAKVYDEIVPTFSGNVLIVWDKTAS